MSSLAGIQDIMSRCRTLMLDMDGTLLDLAFDNYVWRQLVPERYAERHGLAVDEARDLLFSRYGSVQGDLKWYCLDHWSDTLGMDLLGIHRDVQERIDYLPGAERFLESARAHDFRVIMVTNSHPDTLKLKDEMTGLCRYFDAVYSSHTFGFPKERLPFWQALERIEGFDPATSVMVDDTHSVLASSREYGIFGNVSVTRPDTTAPARDAADYVGVEGVAGLLEYS